MVIEFRTGVTVMFARVIIGKAELEEAVLALHPGNHIQFHVFNSLAVAVWALQFCSSALKLPRVRNNPKDQYFILEYSTATLWEKIYN